MWLESGFVDEGVVGGKRNDAAGEEDHEEVEADDGFVFARIDLEAGNSARLLVCGW